MRQTSSVIVSNAGLSKRGSMYKKREVFSFDVAFFCCQPCNYLSEAFMNNNSITMILYQMKGGNFLFLLLLPPLNYDLKMKYVSMGYLLIGTNTNNSQPLRFT